MSSTTPPLHFQDRDGEILQIIYDYGGVLALRHLKSMFWPDKTWRAMERRLLKLYRGRYLDRPSRRQQRVKSVPEPVVWLGWKGILCVAIQKGVVVEPPSTVNENQVRSLEKSLREQGILWLREPAWITLEHDLAAVDFRLAVEAAISPLPRLTLEEWIPEVVFRSRMDVIGYRLRVDGQIKDLNGGVRPDGYFVIFDECRASQGLPPRARFLLELDNATHDGPSFADKAARGAYYLLSSSYKKRFGANAGGRWLVVTTGERRMKNIMKQTRNATGGGAEAFLFTTFKRVDTQNPLVDPIWWQANTGERRALFDLSDD